jgi:hypothetical protein
MKKGPRSVEKMATRWRGSPLSHSPTTAGEKTNPGQIKSYKTRST